MSRAKLNGEVCVQEYLAGLGLRALRFTKDEMRQGRTPDFRVFVDDDIVFYCEVKTAQEDDWLEAQLAAAPPGTLVGGDRFDPTCNRITSHIHSGVGQFDAVNPDMKVPNVLAIVNGDYDAHFGDLVSVMTGFGKGIPMFREYSEGRIRDEKLRVHLYLWFNTWNAGGPQRFFPEVHASHHASLCMLFRVNPCDLRDGDLAETAAARRWRAASSSARASSSSFSRAGFPS